MTTAADMESLRACEVCGRAGCPMLGTFPSATEEAACFKRGYERVVAELASARADNERLTRERKVLEEAAQRIVRESSDGEAMAIAAEALGVPFDRTDDTGAATLSPSPTTTEAHPACTGLTAVWCPVHGDCACPNDAAGERTFTDDKCPLHASGSAHADREREPTLLAPPASSPTTRAEAGGMDFRGMAGDLLALVYRLDPEAKTTAEVNALHVKHLRSAAPAPSTPIDGTAREVVNSGGSYDAYDGFEVPAAPSSIEAAAVAQMSAAVRVACPICQAKPGAECITPFGGVHAGRFAAANRPPAAEPTPKEGE